MILHLPVLLFAVIVIYTVSISWVFGYLLLGDIQRRRRKAKRGRPADHDAAILAVAQECLATAPELADDGEVVAWTVDALTDTFTRTESAGWGTADAGQGWTVTGGRTGGSRLARIEVERLLIEIDRCVECYRHGQDITKDAPKERP